MRRTLLLSLVAGGMLLVPAVSHGQTGDSVVGSGNVFFVPGDVELAVAIDAHSGPSGETPSGSATLGNTPGSVVCLRVDGQSAVVGVNFSSQSAPFDRVAIRIEDGGSGSADGVFLRLGVVFGPNDCPQPELVDEFSGTVISGDFVVSDAHPLPTTKDQCKNGGWKTYGVFKNQGDCVSFVATKGKNQPSGP
jgi:hypothetical protein